MGDPRPARNDEWVQRDVTTPTRAFVLGLADDDGHLDAGALYDAADAAGFTATTMRLALMRLRDARSLTVDGRGRNASIRLTAQGRTDRSPDLAWVAAAYRLDAGLDPWDHRWHLISFEIPEAERAARDAVRTRIVDLFGAQVAGGLYVSPRAWEAWIASTARRHGVEHRIMTAQAPTLRLGTVDSPDAIAAQLWDVEGLERRYREFVDVWSPALSQASAPAESLRAAFAASRELEVLLRDDPLLPAELNPGSSPAQARALYVELLDVFASNDAVARANMFRSYRAAIDRALSQSAADFWSWAYQQTTEPSSLG